MLDKYEAVVQLIILLMVMEAMRLSAMSAL